MRLKRIITLLFVLSLTLTLFSSCTETGGGLKVETTGDDTVINIPKGVDPELYYDAKESLIQLSDETKVELQTVLDHSEHISSDLIAKIDDWTGKVVGEYQCYGEFDNCIVLFTMGFTAEQKEEIIADYKFSESWGFWLGAYCNGTEYNLQEAYNLGYISKEEVGLVHKRYVAVKKYMSELK